jgi:hypothetical protein
MFGFYQNFLPNYELHITPWHVLLKNEPNPPHLISKEQEAMLMTKLSCGKKDQSIRSSF